MQVASENSWKCLRCPIISVPGVGAFQPCTLPAGYYKVLLKGRYATGGRARNPAEPRGYGSHSSDAANAVAVSARSYSRSLRSSSLTPMQSSGQLSPMGLGSGARVVRRIGSRSRTTGHIGTGGGGKQQQQQQQRPPPPPQGMSDVSRSDPSAGKLQRHAGAGAGVGAEAVRETFRSAPATTMHAVADTAAADVQGIIAAGTRPIFALGRHGARSEEPHIAAAKAPQRVGVAMARSDRALAAWLAAHGLAYYADILAGRGLTPERLAAMSDEELSSVGVFTRAAMHAVRS